MKFPYRKLLVVGCGGAGKSTFSLEVGKLFCLPVVHLDKIWWLPGWENRTREEFDLLLKEELKKPAWVMDGNYNRTFAMRLQFCDCCVFLDVPKEECMKSVYARFEQYRGKTRPDMTDGCEERIDEDFRLWIEDFERSTRGEMLSALQESGKEFFVFSSRSKAYDWLHLFV